MIRELRLLAAIATHSICVCKEQLLEVLQSSVCAAIYAVAFGSVVKALASAPSWRRGDLSDSSKVPRENFLLCRW